MEKLKENLPLISGLLLVLGAIRLFYFYSYFGIDIASYIEISEIFSLSLSFFTSSMLFIVPFSLLFLPNSITLETRMSKMFYFKNGQMQREDIENITPTDAVTGIAFQAILYLIALAIYTGYFDFTVTYDMIIGFVLLFILPVISNYLIPSIQRTVNAVFKIELSSGFFASLFLLLSMAIISIGYSRHTARNIELRKSFVYAEAQIDTALVHSSDNYRYIGKTKNYIFFYNKLTKKADAFSLSNSKRVSIINDTFLDGVLMKETGTTKLVQPNHPPK